MKRITYVTLILIFLFSVNAQAYLMVFYKQSQMVYEVSHRSIIMYDKDAQKVGLIPQITFNGTPRDFCVVIPTPSEPKLNTVNPAVFYEAQRLTGAVWRERSANCGAVGPAAVEDSGTYPPSDEGVDVKNEQFVGGYHAITLSATGADALIKWLQKNNYVYSVQDKDILDYYIQRGWVFTAIKIDTASDSTTWEYQRYSINPILLTYTASSLIYPIRLDSINAGDRTDIVIYVLADSKMTFPGARIEYANSISDDELRSIVDTYPAFGGLIGNLRYLTKLEHTFSILQMDEDIEIVPAEDNAEFRNVVYYGFSPITDFFPLGAVAGIYLILRAIKRRKAERAQELVQ